MSADIRCYWDEACTDELFQETTSYSISLGPRTGLNGDTGEITDQTIYLKMWVMLLPRILVFKRLVTLIITLRLLRRL